MKTFSEKFYRTKLKNIFVVVVLAIAISPVIAYAQEFYGDYGGGGEMFYSGGSENTYTGGSGSIYTGGSQNLYTGGGEQTYTGGSQTLYTGGSEPIYTGGSEPIYTGGEPVPVVVSQPGPALMFVQPVFAGAPISAFPGPSLDFFSPTFFSSPISSNPGQVLDFPSNPGSTPPVSSNPGPILDFPSNPGTNPSISSNPGPVLNFPGGFGGGVSPISQPFPSAPVAQTTFSSLQPSPFVPLSQIPATGVADDPNVLYFIFGIIGGSALAAFVAKKYIIGKWIFVRSPSSIAAGVVQRASQNFEQQNLGGLAESVVRKSFLLASFLPSEHTLRFMLSARASALQETLNGEQDLDLEPHIHGLEEQVRMLGAQGVFGEPQLQDMLQSLFALRQGMRQASSIQTA